MSGDNIIVTVNPVMLDVAVAPEVINVEVPTPAVVNVTPQAPVNVTIAAPVVVNVTVATPVIAVSVDPSGAMDRLVEHEQAVDPHPQYLTPAEGDTRYDDNGAAAGEMAAHLAALDPHSQYLKTDELPAAPTRETLGLAVTDTPQFDGIIIPGLVPGTAFKLIVDGDGMVGTEQVL